MLTISTLNSSLGRRICANRSRSRASYLGFLVFVVFLGLASRKIPFLRTTLFDKYPGDALWTVMMFTLCALLAPKWSTRSLGITALLISYLVEFLQLYRAPWLVELRASTAGHLVLGTTFSWYDLIAYTVGGAIAVSLEGILKGRISVAPHHEESCDESLIR